MYKLELKYRDDGTPIIAGYGIVYGAVDLAGDTFTPDTALGPMAALPVFYDHTIDQPDDLDVEIGRVVEIKRDDKGVWFEAELDRHNEYMGDILGLIEAGALGYSTGAVSHLVRREGKAIKRWPVAELSLTPTPAEPRTLGVARVKTATSEANDTAEGSVEAATQPDPVPAGAPVAKIEVVPNQGDQNVDNETTGGQPELKAQIDAISAQMNDLMKALDSRPVASAGYVTQDGGRADAQIKNFPDFLKAVARKDATRLESVYGVKAVVTDTGALGGYTVPTDFQQTLLTVAYRNSGVLSRVRRIQVSAQAGEIPALDIFTAPTAGVGNTALAGRATGAKRAEGGAYTETAPQFEVIRYRIGDMASGYVKVSKEFVADSFLGVESLLRDIIGTVVASKLEHGILNGTGVNEPLGILNSGAKIDISPDSNGVFAYADAAEMLSRFKAVGDVGTIAWIHHPSMFTDLAAFTTGASSPITWVQDIAGQPRQALFGYSLLSSEHSPQADASGCIVLADLSAYMLFEKGGLYIDYSEHADFLNGNGVWRFGYRADGQPWMKSAITLGGAGSAFTVSPFVNFND